MLFKKSSLAAAISLTLSTSVFAYHYNPSAPMKGEIMPIADPSPRFEMSIAALGLKAGASNLNYTIENKELPTQSPSWTEKELRPNYAWAFELGGRYIFPEDMDVSFDWTHLNSSTSSSVHTPDGSYFIGPDYQIGPESLPVNDATGNVQFRYDVVNLDGGKYLDWGNHVRLHLFGGFSNAYLREQVTSVWSGTTGAPFTGPFSTRQTVIADFFGLGPRFGFDASYNLDCGVGFMGEAAMSALIGNSYAKTNFNSSAAELLSLFGQTSNPQFIQDQNVTQVVPGFDAKLGVNYKYKFNRGVGLELAAGYEAAVYVNAINQYIPQSLVQPTTTGGIFVSTMSHTQSNYSVQGPFIKLAVKFA